MDLSDRETREDAEAREARELDDRTPPDAFLLPDEIAYLTSMARCDACGHLEALHNDHCCTFCMIPKCGCYFGEVAP